MQGIEYIYELCEDLPRSGPGDNESTRRAFDAIPQHVKKAKLLDIGCGQGMQTIELAKICDADIIALDNHQGFLDILMTNAKQFGLENKITPLNKSMLEMDFPLKSFDIIWSEGALYNMGFENGLNECRKLLKNDGYLAVTELVYTSDNPPEQLVEYFNSEYPDIKSIEKNLELIKQRDFKVVLNFTLPKSAWLDNYYLHMSLDMLFLF